MKNFIGELSVYCSNQPYGALCVQARFTSEIANIDVTYPLVVCSLKCSTPRSGMTCSTRLSKDEYTSVRPFLHLALGSIIEAVIEYDS